MIWLLLLLPVTGLYLLFRGTMNLFQSVGPIYWITRDIGAKGDPIICKSFTRQTDPPWKSGTGIQVRGGRFTFQIGVCHKPQLEKNEDGMLHALQGRYLEETPSDIGAWR